MLGLEGAPAHHHHHLNHKGKISIESQDPVTWIGFHIFPFSFRCVFKSIHVGLRIQMFTFS